MGLPASRSGDIAGHGGSIVFGATTVMIGGLPAARVGDPFICPGFDGPKPHVMGNLNIGSKTVMIEGAFACRQGDITGCGLAGVSGKGLAAIAGPPQAGPANDLPGEYHIEGAKYGSEHFGVGYQSEEGFRNSDGGGRSARGSVAHASGETEAYWGFKASGKGDLGTVAMEANAGRGAAGCGISGSVFKAEGKIEDSNGNSYRESLDLFNAEAKGNILLGKNGKRTGLGLEGSLQANIIEGQRDLTITTPLLFGYNVRNSATLGASLGSAGGAFNAGAYTDESDNRFHIVAMVDLEIAMGLKIGGDWSIGKNVKPTSVSGTPGIGIPMTPGSIVTGCPTVLIG